MPYTPPPELADLSLSEIADQVIQRTLPPIESWAPHSTGDSHMQICADGVWLHQGSPIRRPAMIRAFASLLMRDTCGSYWLVTPAQKLSIAVEDAAYIATDVAIRDDGLAFRLNTDELIIAGPDNHVIARGDADTPALYVHVRRGCEARLNRSTYQQVIDIALNAGDDWSVTSLGIRFTLIPS